MKYLLENQKTERLKFRQVSSNDFDLWIDFFKQKDVVRFLAMEKIPTPLERCEHWFDRLKHRYENDLGGMNALDDKTTNEMVGQCGLLIQEVDGLTEMEIGYSILPNFWNRGFATEAAKKCRDYAFENNFADSIISIIHIENINSQKVAINNGMVKTKSTQFKEMPVNIFRINKIDWEKLSINE
jgi:RimJ/RimL family protein N-acetyltransferase